MFVENNKTVASTGSINELYENLLQREYTGPISLSDHQVERKAVRSPSLRLRFGRSDPNISPLEVCKKYITRVYI